MAQHLDGVQMLTSTAKSQSGVTYIIIFTFVSPRHRMAAQAGRVQCPCSRPVVQFAESGSFSAILFVPMDFSDGNRPGLRKHPDGAIVKADKTIFAILMLRFLYLDCQLFDIRMRRRPDLIWMLWSGKSREHNRPHGRFFYGKGAGSTASLTRCPDAFAVQDVQIFCHPRCSDSFAVQMEQQAQANWFPGNQAIVFNNRPG